ncbi:MAG: large-conductance mechanosensitive channel protein MscL [Fimbriiglobus sp.]|jgi:large conductance mechanosensitive channel|nr:large-conductance mechanosensitive channel protein MscL [Fimbriiglobus sp.]
MKGLFEEFKAFILRGNVVDLAVGVIIGAAFGGIVTVLVNEILMPPIGWATGGVDFSDLAIDLPGKMVDPATKDKPPAEQKFIPVKIGYGKFLQAVINFLIVGACLFFVVKGTNVLMKKKAAAPAIPPEPTASEKLLAEIRDALKNRQ